MELSGPILVGAAGALETTTTVRVVGVNLEEPVTGAVETVLAVAESPTPVVIVEAPSVSAPAEALPRLGVPVVKVDPTTSPPCPNL